MQATMMPLSDNCCPKREPHALYLHHQEQKTTQDSLILKIQKIYLAMVVKYTESELKIL